jgi:pimeloyl-ACP methyl ester carboxylesterase
MQCIVDEKIVGYDTYGNGKTVLLLHGWGANRKTLHLVADSLYKKYKVLSIDVPGFGESEKPSQAWGVTEYAEWLTRFLEKISVRDIYAVVGHSNGGAIAIKFVSTGYPIQKLVLLGASGIRKRNSGKKLFYRAISKTGKVATIAFPKKLKLRVRDKWYKQIGSELYHAPGMEATFKKVTNEDLLLESAMISCPTLLIYGSQDEATPELFGRMYHESIEGSELDIIEGAGHYSFIDKPEVVLDRIAGFLK